MSVTLMIASPLASLCAMADAVNAELVPVPDCPVTTGTIDEPDVAWRHAHALDQWRAANASGSAADAVVVAVWPPSHESGSFVQQSPREFARRSEWPFAAWYAALGVASSRCADGGAIVALVERPSPLDCAGWAAESGTADAVEALVRSLARSEGPRGIRVNAVTTPLRMAPARPIAPYPSLATFPGQMDHEVTQAVAMLIGPGVAGVTGTVIHADCGRSWR